MRTFTLENLLIALRKEYQENERKLESLKRYIDLSDENKIKEYEVYSYITKNKKIIEFDIVQKQSLLLSIINKLSYDNNKYKRSIEIAHEKNGEKKVLVLPKNDMYTIKDLESLAKESYEILNNEFTKNIVSPEIYVDDARLALQTTTSGLVSHVDVLYKKYLPTGLAYSAKMDKVIITSDDDPLLTEQVKNIFKAEIPEEKLPKYHRNVVNSSNTMHKHIDINGIIPTKETQIFTITENQSTLTLNRKKR